MRSSSPVITATSDPSWRRFSRRRPRRGRARHLLLRRLRLRRSAGLRAGARRRRARRSGRGARGLRRDRPPCRALERSARGLQPGLDLRDQPGRHDHPRSGCESGRRQKVRVRLLLQHVRPGRGRRAARRGSSTAAADALRGVEGLRGGRRCSSSPTRTSRRSSCGMRRSTASRLDFGSTSCSTTSLPGRTRPERSSYRATARRGGRSSMCATSRKQASRSSTRPTSWWAAKRSTSARTRRTTAFVSSPRLCTPGCPTARSRSPRARPPIRGATVSTSRSSRPPFRRARSSGRRSGARTSSRRATRRSDLTFEDFQGHRYIRLGQLRRLLEARAVDSDLRWTADAAQTDEASAGARG